MTVCINTLRMSFNSIVITKSDVDKSTLVRRHGGERNRTTLINCTRRCRLSDAYNLIATTALITFNIHSHRVTKTELSAYEQGKQRLKRFKRTAMATDKYSQIGCSDIEYELALVALILINGGISSVEETKDRAKDGDGDISNGIKL